MEYLPEPLLVFPYTLGPTLRAFSIPLLWSGRLVIFLPGFVSNYPFRHFGFTAKRAEASSLASLFRVVAHHAQLVSQQVRLESKNLEPLGERILTWAAVAPGTQEAYSTWDTLQPSCLSIAAQLLQQTPIVSVASLEFIWRVYEHSLEMGATPERPLDDPSPVIEYFERRARLLGSIEMLLAESLLHRLARFSAKPSSCLSLFTDSPLSLELLSQIGQQLSLRDVSPRDHSSDTSASQLAFALFSAALFPMWQLIEPPFVGRIAKVFENRAEELTAAREYCLQEARTILAESMDEKSVFAAFKSSLARIEAEVQAITELDRESTNAVYRRVTEDPKIWLAVATMIGSSLGSLPAIVPAAAAVTVLSYLGAAALKVSRECRDRLRESDWSLVYYLRQ